MKVLYQICNLLCNFKLLNCFYTTIFRKYYNRGLYSFPQYHSVTNNVELHLGVIMLLYLSVSFYCLTFPSYRYSFGLSKIVRFQYVYRTILTEKRSDCTCTFLPSLLFFQTLVSYVLYFVTKKIFFFYLDQNTLESRF